MRVSGKFLSNLFVPALILASSLAHAVDAKPKCPEISGTLVGDGRFDHWVAEALSQYGASPYLTTHGLAKVMPPVRLTATLEEFAKANGYDEAQLGKVYSLLGQFTEEAGKKVDEQQLSFLTSAVFQKANELSREYTTEYAVPHTDKQSRHAYQIENKGISRARAVTDKNGKIRKEFRGSVGQWYHAELFFGGDLANAWGWVRRTYSRQMLDDLGWTFYHYGIAPKHIRAIEQMLSEDREGFISTYQGKQGAKELAKYLQITDLMDPPQEAFKVIVRPLLSEKEMASTGWRHKDEGTNFIKRNLRFDDKRLGGPAHRRSILGEARTLVPNVKLATSLSKKVSHVLGNGNLKAMTDPFRNPQIVVDGYPGTEGLLRFSGEAGYKTPETARRMAVRKLPAEVFEKLQWPRIYLPTEVARSFRATIYSEDGSPRSEYRGINGFRRFLARNNVSNFMEARMSVLAMLSSAEVEALVWQRPSVPWREYVGLAHKREERRGPALIDPLLAQHASYERATFSERLLEDGKVKPMFAGEEGLIRYAILFHGGLVSRAYDSAISLYGKRTFEMLQWEKPIKAFGFEEIYKRFDAAGLAQEFPLILTGGSVDPYYQGHSGLSRFIADTKNANIPDAKAYAKSVLTRAEYEQLGWD